MIFITQLVYTLLLNITLLLVFYYSIVYELETLIVNHYNKTKKVKKKRKDEKFYSYAPGEEFSPTNWIREKTMTQLDFLKFTQMEEVD